MHMCSLLSMIPYYHKKNALGVIHFLKCHLYTSNMIGVILPLKGGIVFKVTGFLTSSARNLGYLKSDFAFFT